jgi:hypothetical protein
MKSNFNKLQSELTDCITKEIKRHQDKLDLIENGDLKRTYERAIKLLKKEFPKYKIEIELDSFDLSIFIRVFIKEKPDDWSKMWDKVHEFWVENNLNENCIGILNITTRGCKI